MGVGLRGGENQARSMAGGWIEAGNVISQRPEMIRRVISASGRGECC